MDAERHEQVIKALEAYTRKITASPQDARNALIHEGIYKHDGGLAKNYAPLPNKAEKR